MAGNANEIRIEPVDVTWSIEEQWKVTCVADVSDSLDGTYFTLSSAGNTAATHYVWYNSSVGSAADPAPAGLTAIEVAFDPNDSATSIASDTATAVDAVGDFGATSSGADVTITNAAVGESAGAADNDTGFTFAQCQRGVNLDLGLLDGDIEVSLEQVTTEVFAHQTGQTLLADLRSGASVNVSLTIKESKKDTWKELFTASMGGTRTPSGGTELFGWGTNRVGTNTVTEAARLNFHPVALASSDYSRDWTFWKAYPLPESVTFSGENPNVMAVSFKCYRDEARDDGIEIFAIGDYTQDIPTES